MKNTQKTYQNNDLLKRIVNKLILKSCDLLDLGLFHGKMGLVIFFFMLILQKNQFIENLPNNC